MTVGQANGYKKYQITDIFLFLCYTSYGDDMKKVYIFTITCVALLLVAASAVYIYENRDHLRIIPKILGNSKKVTFSDTKIDVVTSLEDTITDNTTVWCGSFNLAWNDLRDNVAKNDIIFNPQLDEVNNLNTGTFTKNDLSESGYYTKYGKKTPELKAEIEKQLKDKWNINSDILNDFTWEKDSDDDFIYAILYKVFNFPNKFNKLDNGMFNGSGEYEYFGIGDKTDPKVRNQVTVLYYNSDDDFAIKVLTKQKDELIFSRGNTETNFLDMYRSIMNKSTSFTGKKSLNSDDEVKIPYIDFNVKKEFNNLENKPFLYSDGSSHYIDKAIQTISLTVDESGGKIKSESGISVTKEIAAPTNKRMFFMNKTFTMFMIESNKELPYFAAKFSSLDEVQKADA